MSRLIIPIEEVKSFEKYVLHTLDAKWYLQMLDSMLASKDIEVPSIPVAIHVVIRTVETNKVLLVEEVKTGICKLTLEQDKLKVINSPEMGYNFLLRILSDLIANTFTDAVGKSMKDSILQPLGVSLTDNKLVVHFVLYVKDELIENFDPISHKYLSWWVDIDEAYKLNTITSPYPAIVKDKINNVGKVE